VIEHGAAHHELTWGHALGSLVEPVVNFTLFAVLLYVFLRGPVLEFLRDRAATLRDALDSGARARREAEALRAKLEQDLADLPRLRTELRDELIETARLQRDRLLETARQTVARLRHDAEIAAGQEQVAARTALRKELVGAAVGGATEIVRSAVGPDDQHRYISELLDEARAL
jgi:F0F1-type ATP synthase membrane subunit b/b'